MDIRVRDTLTLLALTAVLAGCSRATPAPGSLALTPKPILGATHVSASPNPVPGGGGLLAPTTISWVAPGLKGVELVVAQDGRAPRLMARGGARGAAVAKWIVADHKYVFSLYFNAATKQLLGSVTVTRP